jgi:uncharacterized membrane protein YjgN (DUF898 family)
MNDLRPIPPTTATQIAFVGRRTAFRDLVLRGAVLEAVTFGLYRFWLATDMRRHLWSHVEVAGDSPEYTGTARELLIGFLFALAILVPVYLLYFLAGVEAETWQQFASVPLLLFFYAFGYFAVYRARRYRVTRTVFRGVRFWMTGSGAGYAWRALAWGALVAVTLGLALPWREAALERYKMRHTFYGDLQGDFTATGGALFRRGWWLWLLMPFVILLFPLLPAAIAVYKSMLWRWFIDGVRFGPVRLQSALPRGAFIGLGWKLVGWTALVLLVYGIYAAVCLFLITQAADIPGKRLFEGTAQLPQVAMLASLGVGYLVAIAAFNVGLRLFVVRDVFARVCDTTTVIGLDAADAVVARGTPAGALGEGLADGLDVAGF